MSTKNLQTVAGIHLSGPNAHKTSVVIMTGAIGEGNLKIIRHFGKIGGVGRLFSDERLFEIIRQFRPDEVVIDCPVTEPPCVTCQRPRCPGVDACEDLAVAYMQSLVIGSEQGRKRKRPLNPQTQRIWDVTQWSRNRFHLQEPSYSANMAPLVVRAKTLQRRLNSLDSSIKLKETHVPSALKRIGAELSLESSVVAAYKAFGVGRENRQKIAERLFQRKWIALNELAEVSSSAESFHAFIAALVGAMLKENKCELPRTEFEREQGWVFLPHIPSES